MRVFLLTAALISMTLARGLSQEGDCSFEPLEAIFDKVRTYASSNPDSVNFYTGKAWELVNSCQSSDFAFRATMGLGDVYAGLGLVDSALVLYKKAHVRANTLASIKRKVVSRYKVARMFLLKNQLDSAEKYNLLNIKFLQTGISGKPWVDDFLARSFGNMGIISGLKEDYGRAVEFYLQTIRIFEKNDNQLGQAYTYNNIGSVYLNLGDYESSLSYLRKSLEIERGIGFTPGVSETFSNIGGVYFQLDEYDSALWYFRRALQYGLKNRGASNLGTCYLNLGSCFSEMNDYDSSLYYNQKALDFKEASGEFSSVSIIYNNMADIASDLKNPDMAEKYALKGLEYGRESPQNRSLAYRMLATIKNNKKEFKQAYNYLRKYALLNDSIIRDQNKQHIDQLLVEYETNKKEQEIINLSNENRINTLELERGETRFYLMITIVIILVLSAIAMIQMVNQKRLREQQKNISLEQKLLRTQMNPHFIFNSLRSIQSFVMKKETLEAANYLADFSKLMRSILEHSRQEFISLESEMNVLKTYLDLQKLRFQEKFDYSIVIDEEIDMENAMIPPMLTQPFVENAVEHAFNGVDYKGEISIRLERKSDRLKLEIEDNGIGIDRVLEVGTVPSNNRTSLAIQITKERLESIRLKNKISFDLIDLARNDLKGTLVCFTFPMSLN